MDKRRRKLPAVIQAVIILAAMLAINLGAAGAASASGMWMDITGNLSGAGAITVDSSGNVYVIAGNKVEELSNGTWTVIYEKDDLCGGMAADNSGNVYIVAKYPFRIEKWSNVTGTWTNFPTPSFDSCHGIMAVDGSGNIYIVGYVYGDIKILKLTNGTWTDITGNGVFIAPASIAADNSGNVYVVEKGYPGGGLQGLEAVERDLDDFPR